MDQRIPISKITHPRPLSYNQERGKILRNDVFFPSLVVREGLRMSYPYYFTTIVNILCYNYLKRNAR
jgi:hypothetical protein